jgi:hypothetical protein
MVMLELEGLEMESVKRALLPTTTEPNSTAELLATRAVLPETVRGRPCTAEQPSIEPKASKTTRVFERERRSLTEDLNFWPYVRVHTAGDVQHSLRAIENPQWTAQLQQAQFASRGTIAIDCGRTPSTWRMDSFGITTFE